MSADHLDDCRDAPSWAEGMFLLPQHFQQQEIHFADQIAANSRLDHGYAYGVAAWEISPDALQAWKIQIQRLVGRTKSGLQFSFGEGDIPSLNLDAEEFQEIKASLLKNEAVTVYLAFPALRPANRNFTPDDSGRELMGRYREYESSRLDLRNGDNPRPIVLKRLRPRLLFSAEQAADYDYLPICRLKVGSSEVSTWTRPQVNEAVKSGMGLVVDGSYYPPMTLSIACPMARMWLSRAEIRLEAYLRRLKEYFVESGVSLRELSNPEEARFITAFQSLSGLRAWLSVQNASQGVSPLETHLQLCRTVGDLVWVNPDGNLLPNLPPYDHDQISRSWTSAWQMIENCFIDPKSKGIVQIPLTANRSKFATGNETVFSASINSKLFSENWRFYLGIFFGDMSPEDVKRLFNNERLFFNAQLCPWKMGTAEEIESIFTQFKTGVVMQEDSDGKFRYEREKPGLPKKPGWIFYDIKQNPYWEMVREQANLTMRIVPHNLVRADEKMGDSQIQFQIQGKYYKISVSLWAVQRE